MTTAIRAALVLFVGLLAGCSPLSLTIGLGPSNVGLRESTVLADENAGKNKIAMIDITGMIADAKEPGFFGASSSPVDDLVRRLKLAQRDDNVHAVILRINSPGGTVTGSDVMYTEIRRFREESEKPIVASLGEVAASGGYYTALAADKIIAHPTTITGSIGVIIPTMNISRTLTMIGIKPRAVMSGPNKDLASPVGPVREEHYALLQAIVDEFYAQFKNLVIERRPGLEDHNLAEATDGRIVTGLHAAEIGLVDKTGTIHDAFDLAKELAGLETARLVKYSSGGRSARSAYAAADPTLPAASPTTSETNIGLFQIDFQNLAAGQGMWPRAYYLWTPGF